MFRLSFYRRYVILHIRLLVVAVLVLSSALPILLTNTASAYTLLGDREIRISSSVADATGVSYLVNFELPAAINIEGLVIAFCDESPIIGDPDCAVPSGFTLASASLDFTEPSDVDLSTFTSGFSQQATGGIGDNVVTLSSASSASGAQGNSVVLTIEGVTNPSAVNESFYARIMLYETQANATGYTVANNNNPEQAGGIALSTAQTITIEAKVQERITFCVFAAAGTATLDYDDNDCSLILDPVVLGDENGVLDSGMPSISKEAKFNITTNASAGATIRVKGDTLRTGSFSIDEIGDTAATYSAGTEQFGFCVYSDGTSPFAPGGLTPLAPYDSGGTPANCVDTTQGQGIGNDNGALFAFENDIITSTYGSSIATKTAGDWSTGVLVFLGSISTTTEPGIYQATLEFIATGRY